MNSLGNTFVGMLLMVTPFLSGWAEAQQASSTSDTAPEQQQRLELMKSKGTDGSLTILPVRLAGRPFDRVTEVVGLLLEKQGLKNIELGKDAFDPPATADLPGLASAVGEFVKKHPPKTDYVLYAELNGTRETGLNEIRAVVTDNAGAVVWTDLQRPEQETAREPMTLCVLLAQQLSPQLGLNADTAKAAKPGKLADIMNRRSGMPSESERAPLAERQKSLKEAGRDATLLVFPARIGGEANTDGADDLARMIRDAGLCKAVASKESVLLQSPRSDPNELKVLWDLARALRDYAKQHPADADYVLYVDYAFNPQNWEQGFVHFVVCDRKGEWVIVDMQNSHHPDYQRIKPTSREDCDRLLVKRLAGYLR